jgi:hypothetical protein
MSKDRIMRRVARVVLPAIVAVFWLPGQAFAAGRFSAASFGVHLVLSLIGLVVAVILLVEALGVRRVALGGVVAEKISLVVLAVVCLAASALAEWGTNFVVDLTLDQVQLASEVLVVVAMALLAAYFWAVRAGMRRYLDRLTIDYVSATESPAPTPASEQEDRA